MSFLGRHIMYDYMYSNNYPELFYFPCARAPLLHSVTYLL